MKKILHMIYGSEYVEMNFDIPLNVAIERLKSRVWTFSFFRFKSHVMIGSVKLDVVVIRRSTTFVRNSFSPVFIGHFDKEIKETKLSGRFRINRIVQVFTTIWFASVLFFPFFVAVIAVRESGGIWPSLVVGLFSSLASLLLVGISLGIVKFSTWISQYEKDWLKTEISDTINGKT